MFERRTFGELMDWLRCKWRLATWVAGAFECAMPDAQGLLREISMNRGSGLTLPREVHTMRPMGRASIAWTGSTSPCLHDFGFSRQPPCGWGCVSLHLRKQRSIHLGRRKLFTCALW